MANLNKVFLIGNLTRDPELRYTPKGMAIAKFSLAVNRTWKDESGATKEEATFIDIDAFGRQAETIAQYVKKGQPFFVEGRLRLDTWDDKQTNQKRSKLGVVLEGFQFLDFRPRTGDDAGASAPRGPTAQTAPAAPAAPAAPTQSGAAPVSEAGPEEDDVPF